MDELVHGVISLIVVWCRNEAGSIDAFKTDVAVSRRSHWTWGEPVFRPRMSLRAILYRHIVKKVIVLIL